MPDPNCEACGGSGKEEYFADPDIVRERYCRCMPEIEIQADMLRNALRLVLPMAKGYAHEHPVGGNADKVAEAAAMLELDPAGPPETWARWRPIETAPKDSKEVLIWNREGWEIAHYAEAEEDAPDQPGHDAGWIGTYAFPGRAADDDEFNAPQGQPTLWMPMPPVPDDDQL